MSDKTAWTDEQEARHQWLLNHIATCGVCEWRNEDDSSTLCAAARRHLAAPAAHEMVRAGASVLPGLEGAPS